MKQLINLVLIHFFLTSCAQPTHGTLKLHRTKDYYQSSGVVKYFLSDLPDWANASSEGECQRSYTVRYFDFGNLKSSYNIDYFESVQLQYLFNILSKRSKTKYKVSALPLKEEEKFFYNSMDKIKAKLFPFRRPKYKRINLIWVDPFLKDRAGTNKLVQLMKSKIMTLGHPVWVSSCFSQGEIEKTIRSLKLDTFNIRILPIEAFSPFSSEYVLSTIVKLSIRELFEKDQKLYLYIKNGVRKPTEILNVDKIIMY